MKGGCTEIRLKLPDEYLERIDGMQVQLGVRSRAFVFQRALSVLEFLVYQKSLGREIVIRDRNGFEQSVPF